MKKSVLYSVAGWILTLVASFILGLWIYEANQYEEFSQSVEAYKSHFAPYFQGRWSLVYLQLGLASAGLVFMIAGLKSADKWLKVLNIIFIIPCCWVIGLSLFGLM